MRLLTRLAPVALAGLVLAGCGGGGSRAADPGAQSRPPVARTSSSPSAAPLRAVLTTTTTSIVIHGKPAGPVQATLSPTTTYGSARTFLVDRVEGGWVHVFLPTRPNGSTGWVAGTDVRTEQIPDSIVVSLAKLTITVTVSGHDPLTAPAAIGTAQNPTPKGRFYVTDRVQPNNPNGAYGSLALGLSAHSDTLSEFGGGDGQIGIHGTNEPASIGKAASHGCVRVPPRVVDLLKLVPLGTPVTIS